jgi:hypothetical protein
MNRKMVFIVVAVAAICLIAVLGILFIPAKGSQNTGQDYLDIIQGNPPADYIGKLETLIMTSPDPDVRSQGIITLTEIAMERNESEKISGFLKELAMNATGDSVWMAADSSYGLIRSENPPPDKAGMTITIKDPIRKDATIALLVDFTSTIDNSDVRIDIPSLDNSIGLLSNKTVRFPVKANQPQRITFSLKPQKEGKYIIPVVYTMSFDRLDYEKVQKRVFLTVNQTGGSFFVI